MIHLKFTGMCEKCKHADLKLECLEFSSFTGSEKEWDVGCIHAEACDSMESRTIERMKGKENT